MGGNVGINMPLEKQKGEIVDTLQHMNDSMRSFTMDVETRLEKALKSAGGNEVTRKKYGYDTAAGRNMEEFMTNDQMLGIHKDTVAFNRKMAKMQA